ncbi:TPA_asm: RNA-directed RNA polymerase [ssRNA phage SRR6960799_7]|uniref:RNA-directed RNA polymerase n=1 Tax=ssRNA phage SRR6960799_7 TaxID=2786603 RepID=A0A8S5L3M2_9VIRU|nr:RNA-directed RNA polymerase [ssRNA phage SRR6960799_7]DAD52288.1 TPA_asm: RNA-directed RNA polymerase [ssRNA phage SRR6960799_7]
MSKRQNELFQSLEIIESQIRCHPHHWRGRVVSEEDQESISDALLLLVTVWVECFSPEVLVSALPAWVPRWVNSLLSIDVDALILCLKGADETILSCFHTGGIGLSLHSYDGFKHHLSHNWDFAGAIIAPAKQDIHSFLSDGKKVPFVRLHQGFSFLLRLSLRDVKELDAEMLTKYRDNQSRLLPFNDPCIDEHAVIAGWFKESDPLNGDYLPMHGSGAVAESGVHSIAEKYRCGGPDQLLRYCLNQEEIDCPFPFANGVAGRTARVELVPKSATAKRSITMEPAVLMYYQQGVRRFLDNFLGKHRYLKSRISIHDQTTSQRLCLHASADGALSTIDLSMASDSVTYTHFKRLFADTPIVRLCRGCRSSIVVYPNGEQQDLVSYAGMGNATTFPIECIVFASICESVIKAAGRNPSTSKYHVHGDDIIIETKYVDALMIRLSELGFLPNTDKSFYSSTEHGTYRESCGVEALDGREVTPIRIPRNFSGMSLEGLLNHPERISGLINLSNTCFNTLLLTRLLILHKLFQLPVIYQPKFGDGNGTLLSLSTSPNYNLQSIWFPDTCTTIVSHGVVSQKCESPAKDDAIRLFETLRLMGRRTHFIVDPVSVSRPRPSILDNTWS